jgi:hypothetical protein
MYRWLLAALSNATQLGGICIINLTRKLAKETEKN